MNNTELTSEALEALAWGSRRQFFDLLTEDVVWEWSRVAGTRPIVGKAFLTESFMHGGVDLSDGFRFEVSHVYDRDGDGKVILADLAGHVRGAGGRPCRDTYYTWSFDVVARRVTHVYGYMEPKD